MEGDRVGRLRMLLLAFSYVTCTRTLQRLAVNFRALVVTTLCYTRNDIVTGLHIKDSGSFLFERLRLVSFRTHPARFFSNSSGSFLFERIRLASFRTPPARFFSNASGSFLFERLRLVSFRKPPARFFSNASGTFLFYYPLQVNSFSDNTVKYWYFLQKVLTQTFLSQDFRNHKKYNYMKPKRKQCGSFLIIRVYSCPIEVWILTIQQKKMTNVARTEATYQHENTHN